MEPGDKIRTDLNYQTFGCEKKYFERHIQDKELTVTQVGTRFIYVLDENDQTWAISIQDIKKEIDKDIL